MSAVTRPRGPLPSRVYWFRRGLVLTVLVVVVLAVTRLVGGGDGTAAEGDPAPARAAARQAAAEPSPSGSSGSSGSSSADTAAPEETTPAPSVSPAKPKPTKRPLPKPDGPCDPTDVLVSPEIEEMRHGRSVDITLSLTTIESAACTFEVGPEALFVTVSSETRTLWASQHCGSVVPTEEVVPRRTKAAEVVLRWDGRESAVDCPSSDRLAPGDYTVAAMARGSVNVQKSAFTVSSG